MEHGYANGYVGFLDPESRVPEDAEALFEVHGGITYDETPDELWNGVETIEGEFESGMRVLGFDTYHYNDNSSNWDRKAVIEEALNLQRQIKEYLGV